MSMVRVRFAPSPTGFLHLGGLRTALYNYLFARHQDGVFILRIEDTDRSRIVSDGIQNIIKALEAVNLIWNEGPFWHEGRLLEKGTHGPYLQSQRLEIYQEKARFLVEHDQAYYCFCPEAELMKRRERQVKEGKPPKYDPACRHLSSDLVRQKQAAGEPAVIRLKIPLEGKTIFSDLIHGQLEFQNDLLDDQILLKSDGFPTYHLANIVDDHLMEITHVIRGDEWLPSTPKHILLYQALGWLPPIFAHLPLLLNPDRSKLSKRSGEVAVEEYLRQGYLPEALINFVALLGWNPSADQEIYSREELIKKFNLEKVNKSGAVVNFEKLKWLNGEYIRALDPATLARRIIPWLLEAGLIKSEKINEEFIKSAGALVQDRLLVLSEAPGLMSFLFQRPVYEAALLSWKKMTNREVSQVLTRLAAELEKFGEGDWQKEKLEKRIKNLIVQEKLSVGQTLWPLRAALTGREASPGPFEVAAVLGKKETIERINYALSLLGA